MKPHLLYAILLVTTVSVRGQHMTEIKNTLYPKFNAEEWMREDRLTEDYKPIDFSLGDEAPNAFDYENSFKGYYTLEGFLRKRNREIMNQLDAKGKAAFSAGTQRWRQKRDAQCNAVWKMEKVEYSQSVMDYMYCMSAMTRVRLDSLGGGIPPNKKVDQFSGAKPFLMDADLNEFSDLVATGESKSLKFFKPKDQVTMMGQKADVRLGFINGKLSDIKIDFGKCYCETKVMNETVREIGKHTTSTYDPILLYSTYTWEGSKIYLRLIDSESRVVIEIWKK